MYRQNPQVTMTLKNISKLFAMMRGESRYNFLYVKDGVANVTDKKSIFMRIEVECPDGQFHLNEDFALVACNRPIDGPFSTKFLCPIEPELIRPPFEQMRPFCSIEPQQIRECLSVIQKALEMDENIYIERTGLGLKRTGEIYHECPFNLPCKLELDPFLLGIAFADALRYTMVELYQEIRQDHGEMPKTPLVIGYGWKNCTLLTPIIDTHRNYYR